MKSIYVLLDTVDKVKLFVNLVNKYDGEFDLVSGRYVVDAKSIMGIFSLDLSKKIRLDVNSSEVESFIADAKEFIVE